MEQHQERYIKPGDLLFTNYNDSDGSAPPDEQLKDADTQDATHDNTTSVDKAQQIVPVMDPRIGHPFYTELLRSRDANEETTFPRVSKHNINPYDMLKDTTKAVPTPEETPDSAPIFSTTTASLRDLPEDPHALGIMLESTYRTTASEEIKPIIACLVNLDVMITTQTRLNELHEAHTAKNFREQRHLNKDRKLHLGATMKSVNHKFASLDAQRMAQEKAFKQCEIRTNSHAMQLRSLIDKAQMLAKGGESMEARVTDTNRGLTDLQGEMEGLKVENRSLRDEIRGLKEEINKLKEKDEVWERRLTALERLIEYKKDRQSDDSCVNKQQVLNAANFAVGNARIFPFPDQEISGTIAIQSILTAP